MLCSAANKSNSRAANPAQTTQKPVEWRRQPKAACRKPSSNVLWPAPSAQEPRTPEPPRLQGRPPQGWAPWSGQFFKHHLPRPIQAGLPVDHPYGFGKSQHDAESPWRHPASDREPRPGGASPCQRARSSPQLAAISSMDLSFVIRPCSNDPLCGNTVAAAEHLARLSSFRVSAT